MYKFGGKERTRLDLTQPETEYVMLLLDCTRVTRHWSLAWLRLSWVDALNSRLDLICRLTLPTSPQLLS